MHEQHRQYFVKALKGVAKVFYHGYAVEQQRGSATEEERVIVGFGSILLDRPLRFAHPAGATITQLPLSLGTPAAQAAPEAGRAAAKQAAWPAEEAEEAEEAQREAVLEAVAAAEAGHREAMAVRVPRG